MVSCLPFRLEKIAWQAKITSAGEGSSFNIYDDFFFLFCGEKGKRISLSLRSLFAYASFYRHDSLCEAGKRKLRFYKTLVLSREGKKERPLLVHAELFLVDTFLTRTLFVCRITITATFRRLMKQQDLVIMRLLLIRWRRLETS